MNHVARIKRAQRARWERRPRYSLYPIQRQVFGPTVFCFDEATPVPSWALDQLIRRTAGLRRALERMSVV